SLGEPRWRRADGRRSAKKTLSQRLPKVAFRSLRVLAQIPASIAYDARTRRAAEYYPRSHHERPPNQHQQRDVFPFHLRYPLDAKQHCSRTAATDATWTTRKSKTISIWRIIGISPAGWMDIEARKTVRPARSTAPCPLPGHLIGA